jgi:hypothetical protein
VGGDRLRAKTNHPGKGLLKNCFPVRLSAKKRLDILINVYVIYTYLRVETCKVKWRVIHQIVAREFTDETKEVIRGNYDWYGLCHKTTAR